MRYVNGCIGTIYLKGGFRDFLPFIILGTELHAGSILSNSQGYYQIHENDGGYFKRFFPRLEKLTSVVKETLENHDTASDMAQLGDGAAVSEEKVAHDLFNEITTGTYQPSPATAFLIKKKDGTGRMVEQENLRDLIVQKYLLTTVSEPFNRVLEESSIGFRKGMSREKAAEMVGSALAAGYQYVLESDIEDFFGSVDIEKLVKIINFYLPEGDALVGELLKKTLKSGYVLNGKYYERMAGLAQGSPLSPLLANLYLDSFDEDFEKYPVRFIRYADDFIVLTKTREDAEKMLVETETMLGGLGLRINKTKTAIKPVGEGFRFLGIRFTRSEVTIEPEEELRKLTKPLYVVEPYSFLGINGEALEVRRNGAIVETIPLRRISEVIVMDRASFSTSLIRKCVESNIPVTLTLGSGYFITTVKPDSKRYYETSLAHGKRYAALSDVEILSYAKEFAAGKILNYAVLLRQRYTPAQGTLIKELEQSAKDIYAASNVNEVRGFEGSIAKKIYRGLNEFIEPPSFRITKRERKNPDRINSLINFGHYLLFSRINATLRAVGLNPYLGFLHAPEDNYESLVCDIQELFRARIDRFLIKVINLKVIGEDDFVKTDRGQYLKKEISKKFLEHFEREMERKSDEEKLTLKDEIYLQVTAVKQWALDDKELSVFKWNR